MRRSVLALLVPLAACGSGANADDGPGIAATGSGTTRSYPAEGFSAVELRGPDDVDVRVGAGFSVRAEGEAKVLDTLRIERIGDTLRVGRVKRGGISWGDRGAAKVYVTMPRMTAASLAGSGDMTVDRAEGTRFSGSIAGSGKLAIGAIAAEDVDLSIAGSGDLAASGHARSVTASIAGSGDIDASRLEAAQGEVSIAGSGSIRAMVDGPAKVSIMGSGDVDLGPKARCTTSKMGSGEVRCGS